MRSACLLFLLALLVRLSRAQLPQDIMTVGFVYGNLPNDLSWTYAQDLGRAFLEFSDPTVKTRWSVAGFACDALLNDTVKAFIDANVKLIILTSGAYEPCGPSIARQYPNTFFMCMGCRRPADSPSNYGATFSRIYEARYVQGVLAGLVTKTKKIGFIGSIEFGGDRLDPNTLLLGARLNCPDCVVIRYGVGSFYDPVRCMEAARRLIAEGCDVIAHLHDAFNWFPLAVAANISVFGHDVDQISLAPKNMLTSSYYIWGPFLEYFVQSIRNNSYPQEVLFFGLRERGVGMAAFTNMPDSVAAIGYQQAQRLTQLELLNGQSEIFCGPEWDKLRQGSNYSACLNANEVVEMFEYVNGVQNRGAVPEPVRPLNYVKWNDSAAVALLVITGICVFAVLVMFVLTIVFHDTTVVKVSHPFFMYVTYIGLLLGMGAVFTYPGKLKDNSCVARTWTAGLGFALTFAPMIAKNYRLARIMGNTAMISTVIPTHELLGVAGGVVGIEVLLLVLWSVIPSARLRSSLHHDGAADIVICRSDKMWPFLGIQLAYIIGVIVAGFVLSYMTRKIARRVLFREAQWINYAFYSAAVWVLLFALATGLLWNSYVAMFVLSILAILALAMFTLFLIVGPKMYVLFFVKGGRESGSVTGSHSSEFSTDFKPDADRMDFNNFNNPGTN